MLQTFHNRVRVARAERVRMVCHVWCVRALDGRLVASMLLMVGGRPKTAGLTVLRLMLVDRDPLCHHDMRVPTGSHFVIELRIVGWWITMASRV